MPLGASSIPRKAAQMSNDKADHPGFIANSDAINRKISIGTVSAALASFISGWTSSKFPHTHTHHFRLEAKFLLLLDSRRRLWILNGLCIVTLITLHH